LAFSSTNPPVLLVQGGMQGEALVPSSSLAFNANRAPQIWHYGSTHVVADIVATGFFAACGYGSRSATTPTSAPPNRANVGMRIGDLVLARCSSDAAVPGRMTIHSVIASTANQASTVASSGWFTGYDVTISGT
jgi:hypothetical protein